MSEHLPECPILQPCSGDLENPELCECLHCMAECICERLRACEDRTIAAALQRVAALVSVAASEWTYLNLVWRAEVVAAIEGDQP